MRQYTYLIINPFGPADNGVAAYTNSLKAHLKDLSIDHITLKELPINPAFSLEKLRAYVHHHITTTYGYDEVLIEAPETRAATLYLPKEYRVLIRLHCPLKVAEEGDLKLPNQSRYSDELRVIHKATVISSPSFGLARAMADEVDPNRLVVYKNPIDPTLAQFRQRERPYDLVFMGRFMNLKGADYLLPILKRLPAHYRVLLFGPGGNRWKEKCLETHPIPCEVTVHDNISGDVRFEHLGSAKVSIVPSRFENCSMAILESLAVGTPVVAWDVGGNGEIAQDDVLRLAPLGNIHLMVSHIIDFVESPRPSNSVFDETIEKINTDFHNGWTDALNRLMERPALQNPFDTRPSHRSKGCTPLSSIQQKDKTQPHLHKVREKSIEGLFYKLKIFGFSISNEHLEEMWMPIIEYLGADYQFVCPRLMGHVTRFDTKYPINGKKLSIYNWEHDPNRLIAQINAFRPDLIFFHNGLHPRYQGVLQYIRERVGVPFVYTELGWLPQHNHIYFDRYGVNARSELASFSAEVLTETEALDDQDNIQLSGRYTIILGQLENDTNLIISSPRFHSMTNFIEHVISELPADEDILIKPHPMDNRLERYEPFLSNRIKLVTHQALDQLLPQAKAVVGINSTAFFEVLKYPINIYAFGHSILDNKGVLIDCTQAELHEKWTDQLVGSMKRRRKILEAFQKRQINVNQLLKEGLQWAFNTRALDPLVDAMDLGAPKHQLYDQAHIDQQTHVKIVLERLKKKVFPFNKEPGKHVADFLNELYVGAQTGKR